MGATAVMATGTRIAETCEFGPVGMDKVARFGNRRWQPDPSLRSDFLDDENWRELAKQRGVRLPRYGTRATHRTYRAWLGKLGLSLAWWRRWTGWRTLEEDIAANPDWPLRAFVGMLLEEVSE